MHTSRRDRAPSGSWAQRVSDVESMEALRKVMDDWYVRAAPYWNLLDIIGFDSYMKAGDWEGAKGSLVRTHGRSNPAHWEILDVLDAAMRARRLLSMRPLQGVNAEPASAPAGGPGQAKV